MNKHTLLALALLVACAGNIVAAETSVISEVATVAEQAMDVVVDAAAAIVTPVSEKTAEVVTQAPAFYARMLNAISDKSSAATTSVKAFINSLSTKAVALVPSKETATTFVADNKYAVAAVGAIAVAASAYAGYKLYTAKTPKKAA